MAVKQLQPLRMVASPATDSRVVTDIYRPFFLAGILSVLTAGCALGAVALLGIALQGSFTANFWTPYVLAHANSQLFGWVGFFVMGFALQQHAPRKSRERLFYRLATASLCLMAVGIVLRFFAEPLVTVQREFWLPVGVLSAVLQALAVALFMVNTAVTRFKTGQGLTWQTKFVFASLGWLLLVSTIEPFAFLLSHQESRLSSQLFIAEWFSPLREAQFLGFVANMIFGVALVKMHSCFGAPEARRTWGNVAFGMWNVGLIVRSFGWLAQFRSDFDAGSGLFFHLGGAMMALGAASFVFSSGMFSRISERIPAHKFVRAAFAWLLVAGLMVMLEPLHLAATGQPFSHAYTGAIRHALTVGFISQMIIGVGMHVIARMNDIPRILQPALWSTFILLNIGNALRVGLEVATDYSKFAFLPMGLTGFIELAGLSIWGILMAKTMIRHRKGRTSYA